MGRENRVARMGRSMATSSGVHEGFVNAENISTGHQATAKALLAAGLGVRAIARELAL